MAALVLATDPTAARFAVLAVRSPPQQLSPADQLRDSHTTLLAVPQGGFIPFDESMAEMMTSGAPIPAEALVVSGETDQLVPPERSRQLQALFGKYTARAPAQRGANAIGVLILATVVCC